MIDRALNRDNKAAIDDALARAVVYRALSVGLQMPTVERLRQIGVHARLATVAAALRHLDRQGPRGPLTLAAKRLAAFTPPSEEALAASFVRLFGHTTRGAVCACETEYGADNVFHQPQQLADISGYYLAFGLTPTTACDARADHVACECEFVHFLNCKEAFFLATRAEDETLEITRLAGRSFLRDHLGRFGLAFATRVIAEDSRGFFGLLGLVLLEMLEDECRRLNIAIGPVDLTVRPDVPDEAPMACGTASELIQIRRHP